MKHSLHALPPGNSFVKLPQDFYSQVQPTLFESSAELIHFNPAAAELLQQMAHSRTDSTNTFRELCEVKRDSDAGMPVLADHVIARKRMRQ